MKKVVKNLLRLVWYIPYRILKALRFGKVLYISIGWDTLYPFSPYSEGGLLRKDFLELYKKYKQGNLTTEEYHHKEYGEWDEKIKKFSKWEQKFAHQACLKTWWMGGKKAYIYVSLFYLHQTGWFSIYFESFVSKFEFAKNNVHKIFKLRSF